MTASRTLTLRIGSISVKSMSSAIHRGLFGIAWQCYMASYVEVE